MTTSSTVRGGARLTLDEMYEAARLVAEQHRDAAGQTKGSARREVAEAMLRVIDERRAACPKQG